MNLTNSQNMEIFTLGVIILLTISYQCFAVTEEDEGVKFADKCEVCKIVSKELENRLEETGKSRDIIEIGYSLDDVGGKKKRTTYKKSELRLVESLEGICNRILEYNVHKERTDSSRFAKGMSQTFQALHGLVNKGVKVELGIPHELWDKPSVEITKLKLQCESFLEEHESDIEEWYFKSQEGIPLKTFLCSRLVSDGDDSCLTKEDIEDSNGDNEHKLDLDLPRGHIKAKESHSKPQIQKLKSDQTNSNDEL